MRRRHANFGKKALAKAEGVIETIVGLAPSDAIMLAKTAVQVERVVRGLSPDGERATLLASTNNTVNVLYQGQGPAWLQPKTQERLLPAGADAVPAGNDGSVVVHPG